MDILVFASVVFGALIRAFAIERFMRVFYEQRRTHLTVLVASFALVPVVSTVLEILVSNGISITLLESDYASFLIYHLPVIFILTFNYESTMVKRIVATGYILITYEAIFTALANLVFFPVFSLFDPFNRALYNAVIAEPQALCYILSLSCCSGISVI